jgi:hypothetical protein
MLAALPLCTQTLLSQWSDIVFTKYGVSDGVSTNREPGDVDSSFVNEAVVEAWCTDGNDTAVFPVSESSDYYVAGRAAHMFWKQRGDTVVATKVKALEDSMYSGHQGPTFSKKNVLNTFR